MEWEEEEEHSIIDSKIAYLVSDGGFVAGARVSCRLKQGTFPARVLTAGSLICQHVGREFHT